MSTCVRRLVMGGQTDSQVHAISRQFAKNPFQCSFARAAVQRKKNTETDLRRLALAGHTVKTLHSLACKFELDHSGASHRKPSQVHTSHGQTEVTTSFQFVITCYSVWPGLNRRALNLRCFSFNFNLL